MSKIFNEKYIRIKEVSERFGVCTQTLFRWSEAGHFPKPLRFNLRTTVWLRSEVDEFEAKLEQERHGTKQLEA